tara:strand:- start:523 stop:1353 length:831 start_codon:yes stop_codon:yes gene_type:complete
MCISKRKIVVIGDLRGDSEVLIKSLEMANVVKDCIWIGKDTYVVQMGNTLSGKSSNSPPLNKDYIMSCDEIKIINLINLFDSQAKLFSGRVMSLLGKHELLSHYHGYDADFMKQYIKKKDDVMYKKIFNCNRNTFWKPGNDGGKILSKRPLFVVIDKLLFTNFNLATHKYASTTEIYKNKEDVASWLYTGKNKPDIISNEYNSITSKLNYDFLKEMNCEIVSSNSFDILDKNLIRVKCNASRAFGGNDVSVEILEIVQQPTLIIKRVTKDKRVVVL